MTLKKSKFPNRLLVLPNAKYFFSKIQTTNDLWKVARIFDCDGVATVFITSIGAFGFIFPDSSNLASIDVLKYSGNGSTPPEVMENEDDIHDLQLRRMLFVNFVSAAFFGRVSAKTHRSLAGALYSGQDKIAGFNITQGAVSIQWTELIAKSIKAKVNYLNSVKWRYYFLRDSEIDDGISYIKNILQRQNNFEYADLQSCMVMNYQAAILHNQQHAAASLALNFSVIESLAWEIFIDYGLVDETTPKPFAIKKHNIAKVSKTTFNKMSISKVIEILYKGNLFNDYFYQRVSNIREKRNKLMHKGAIISPKDSGDCQTIVRDLWAFLIDTPFELIAGWSYLR
ncbi:MAG: hypothetical protein WC443_01570 [Desulfobaccales bacterium]